MQLHVRKLLPLAPLNFLTRAAPNVSRRIASSAMAVSAINLQNIFDYFPLANSALERRRETEREHMLSMLYAFNRYRYTERALTCASQITTAIALSIREMIAEREEQSIELIADAD